MLAGIEKLRREYQQASLRRADVLKNPVSQFQKWFEEVVQSEISEPNAMVLATTDAENRPAARIVLLKGLSEEGFVFYTNYESRKGEEIHYNHRACLLFYWKELERQVRVEGTARKLSEEASTLYFQSRPKPSQIAAWASSQSKVIESRSVLEQRFAELSETFSGQEALPRPLHWGGYVVKPDKIEFWQGRPSRLHDRILYSLTESNEWKIERLAP